MPKNNLQHAFLIPVLFVFLWSTGFIGAKSGLPAAEPFTFLGVRMAFTLMALLAIIPFFTVTWPRSFSAYLHLAVVGTLIHGVYLGGVFFAIYRGVDAGLSAIIVGLQPLLTVIFSTIWLREPLSALKVLGLTLGLAGIVIVIGQKGIGVSGVDTLGLWFCIGSLIAISIGTIYQKKFCTSFDLLPGIFVQYVAAALFYLTLSTLWENQDIYWSLRFSLALAWLVIVLSIGAVLLLMWLIRVGEAGKVASFFYLTPPFVAVEAWFLFDERLSLYSVLGMILCVIGVFLVVRSPSTRPA